MKRFLGVISVVLLGTIGLAQERQIMPHGDVLPANCAVGEIFILGSGPVIGLHECISPNVWRPVRTDPATIPGASAPVWGDITGTVANQTDLQSALDAKVATNDARLSDSRSPTAHTHPQSDITNLVTALSGKVDTSDARLTDARTPVAHTHLQPEITGLSATLLTKSNTGHTHTQGEITGLAAALLTKIDTNDARLTDARTPLSHTHVDADIPNTITIDLAATATALAANPADCAANQFATAIGANGDLTCVALTDAAIPDTITVNNATLAATATALAANPTDCAANQFATTIAANGNLTCAAITDADVPDNITVSLAAAATALAANPTDCAANQFATTIGANGNLTCAALTDADIPDTITVNSATTAATATALASDPADCTGGQFAVGITANGTATCQTPSAGTAPTFLRVTADVSNSTVNFSNVTGLTLAVGSGVTVNFSCNLIAFAAATTTAPQFGINGPTASAIDLATTQATTSTAVFNSVVTAYDTNVNPVSGITTPGGPVQLYGSIVTTASGTFAVRIRSEVAASAVTVKRGSWCMVNLQ